MYLNLKNVLGATLLVSIALLSWLWNRQTVKDEPRVAAPISGPLGYYLNEARIMGTGEDGQPLYRIQASSAEEHPDEGRLVLNNVTVEFQPEHDVPWVLKAIRGEIHTNESYLDLTGNVELATSPEGGLAPTIIRTTQLRLELLNFVASTNASISIFIGTQRLNAVGMRADLKTDNLALESNVHGQFLP
jgi:LPS export ABC transporter protein LptC